MTRRWRMDDRSLIAMCVIGLVLLAVWAVKWVPVLSSPRVDEPVNPIVAGGVLVRLCNGFAVYRYPDGSLHTASGHLAGTETPVCEDRP